MAHLDTLRVASGARRVVQHVNIFTGDCFRLENHGRGASCLTDFIESEHADTKVILSTLSECYRFFVRIEHHNVLDMSGKTLITHAKHLLEVR